MYLQALTHTHTHTNMPYNREGQPVKRTRHLLTLRVICWRFSSAWKLTKSPPCMWYSAGWQNRGLLFFINNCLGWFSNVFTIKLYYWFKEAIHHTLTNQNEDNEHATNQIQRQIHLSIILWPFPELLITRDWCVTLPVGIIIAFKASSHQKTTLKNQLIHICIMIHPMLQSVTFSRRPLRFKVTE